jgi:DNA polymerase III subunit delta
MRYLPPVARTAQPALDPIRDAAAGALAPIYILSSPDPLLIDRAVAAIREAAVPEALRGFNYDVVEGKGATASRILAAARTLPMMAERRLVLVRDLAPMAAAELTELLPYLDDPNPSTVLVAITTKLDKRIKFYAAARKKGALCELEPPRNLAAWIRAEADERGIPIDQAACARLADVVGKDLSRLALSLDQLHLYTGGRPIAVDDVDDLIAETRERTVFELTDAIGEGALPRALEAVAALCEQRQSPIGVVVMLARHIRQLAACHAAVARRLPRAELPRAVGAPPFIVDKLMAQARRYPPEAVARGLVLLSEADGALKGVGQTTRVLGRQLGERVLLDRLVTELIGLGAAGGARRTAR